MQVHKRGMVYDEDLFEKVLQGQPVDLSKGSSIHEESKDEHEDVQPSNPEDWEREVDDRGRAYYKNKHTGATRWTKPDFFTSEDNQKS